MVVGELLSGQLVEGSSNDGSEGVVVLFSLLKCKHISRLSRNERRLSSWNDNSHGFIWATLKIVELSFLKGDFVGILSVIRCLGVRGDVLCRVEQRNLVHLP